MEDKILKKYKLKELPIELKNALELNDEKNGVRKMGLEEILSANEDLQVDFNKYNLIPVFDAFDNDYICFQILNNKWCFFNSVDEICFKKDSSLQSLIALKR